MGKGRALVNRLKRREKKIRNNADGFDTFNKADLSEETMAESPKAYQLARKVQRRLDRNFGIDAIGHKPHISKRENILTVQRFDFGVSDFGTRITMAAGIIADMGLRPGDIVFFLEGLLKGEYLKVVAITDSTHARLEDSSALNYPGAEEKTEIDTVADVAGSLNNKYWRIHSANNVTSYYVWYNVNGAGVDPAPGGTGIMVAVPTNASASAVATATAAAVDASSDFSANSNSNRVYVTNSAVGPATDAADFNTTFTITVLTQGASPNPTESESNIEARFQLSDVKGTYL